MTDRFEARVSKARTLMLVAGGFVMGAAGAFVALNPAFETRPIAQLAGWVGLVFFPLCSVVGIRQLFRTGPVMEIGPEGVRWKRWSDDTIPWTAFTRAAGMQVGRQKMLSLWLADPESHRSTTLLGRLAGANKSMGFGDLALTTQGTDRRFDDMAAAVHANAPHLFVD